MNPNIIRLDCGIFVIKNDTHLSRWVERDGRLDHAHQFLEQFKHLVPVGGTVVDCGTSIGDHTVTYASWVGGEGKVLGFEANPDAAECAALNLTIYPHAQIHNVGLSDHYGVSGIAIDPNVGASMLSATPAENVVHVKLAPLDSFINEVNRCDFMKVDIEGSEVSMLYGARDFISRYHPAILMEINKRCLLAQGSEPQDIFDYFDGIGYKWVVADGKVGTDQYEILAQRKKS